MSSREKTIPPPILWPCALLCFWCILLGNALSFMPGMSTDLSVYTVIAAFGLFGAFMCWRTIRAVGLSWRSGVCVVLLLAAGKLVSWGLMLSEVKSFDDVKDKLNQMVEEVTSLDFYNQTAFSSMEPNAHLAAAAKLIFDVNKQDALLDARRHLAQIPTYAPEHSTALTLFKIIDSRLSELNGEGEKRPAVEVIDRARNGNHLSVTIRNNSSNTVRTIDYSLSFFRSADGTQLMPDRRGRLTTEIAASKTKTIELTDDLLNKSVYPWAGLLGWTFASGS